MVKLFKDDKETTSLDSMMLPKIGVLINNK